MSETTRYVADLWCLHCARRAGSWEWLDGSPFGSGSFVPASREGCPSILLRPLCPSCGGPVYMDEVQTVKEFERADWSKAKRGRKPKLRSV